MGRQDDGNRMIKVKVRLYASLRDYLPGLPIGTSTLLEMPPRATVGDVLTRLEVPSSEVKNCFVNGVQREFSWCLKDSDELAFFPPVGGGRY